MMRVVLDTNIFISAFLFAGRPAHILQMAENHLFDLLISPEICDEVEEVLSRKFKLSETAITEICEPIWQFAKFIHPNRRIAACIDPDDDRILECAVTGKADYIVTGDAHLLKLGSFKGIRILRVDEFLKFSDTAT